MPRRRFSPTAKIALGLLVTSLALAGPPGGQPQAGQALDRAEELFRRGSWADARTAFDAARTALADPDLVAADRAVAGAVQCSLHLDEWEDAWKRVRQFLLWEKCPEDPKRVPRLVRNQEQGRELLARLAEHLAAHPGKAARDRVDELREQRLDLDLRLVDNLLSREFLQTTDWYPRTSWWWGEEWTPPDPTFGVSAVDQWRWAVRPDGVPAGPDGKPRFVAVPDRYAADLERAPKILYLLRELERLDTSGTREMAARAVLRRATIARALYGPSSDPDWRSSDLNYVWTAVPEFGRLSRPRPVKPYWQLEDDEVRTVVAGRLKVVRLPAEEDPLALWRRLQRQYPRSSVVPEAIFQRARYLQSRFQFARAVEEYQPLLRNFPKHERTGDAKKELKRIARPGVMLTDTKILAPGSKPVLGYAWRQTGEVQFTVQAINFERYIREAMSNKKEFHPAWGGLSPGDLIFRSPWDPDENARLAKYLGKPVADWKEVVALSERAASATTTVPVSKVGAYLVEARVTGVDNPARAVVVITDVALVFKTLSGRGYLYAADARTGRPLAGQELRLFKSLKGPWDEWDSWTVRTDDSGVVAVNAEDHTERYALAVTKAGGFAAVEYEVEGPSSPPEPRLQLRGVTDRPVYSPGSTIHFRMWARMQDETGYRMPQDGLALKVRLRHSERNEVVRTLDVVADQWGGVTGSFELSREAPLGSYYLETGGDVVVGFRVEAYKKPEMDVTVRPGNGTGKLGSKASFRVSARYFFGKPVAGARLRYQVFRDALDSRPAVPGAFDWLYGPGYGRYGYVYPWLATEPEPSPDPRHDDEDEYERWQRDQQGPEIVARGEARLDDHGEAVVEVRADDLRKRFPGEDHHLTVAVEVHDDSRRTVYANGEFPFYDRELAVRLETDRGWYRPGEAVQAEGYVRNNTGQPASVFGRLWLERVVFPGGPSEPPRFDLLQSWPVGTDPQGRFRVPLPPAVEGQYRLVFRTWDAQDREVGSHATFWVHGPGFDGRRFCYAPLEIIPDRPTYRVGETARLLIHTSRPDGRVWLRSPSGDNGAETLRFFDTVNHCLVVEVPVRRPQVPNFFVEGTAVADGRVTTEVCKLCVPPMNDLLDVRLEADRAEYRPGTEGTVTVRVRDAEGKPVAGQVTLTAYDKAVTAFQDRPDLDSRDWVLERKQHFRSEVRDSLREGLSPVNEDFESPEFDDREPRMPAGGGGGGYNPKKEHFEDSSPAVRSRATREKDAGVPPRNKEPEVRRRFEDAVLWRAAVALGPDGSARAALRFPQSLTSWRLRAWALTNATEGGDAAAEVRTTKDFLIRLQAPRFLVQGDEAVLSANVHNGLAREQAVAGELSLPAPLFGAGSGPGLSAATADGRLMVRSKAVLAPQRSDRFDWPIRALAAGQASVTVKAVGQDDGDAVELPLPILVHGVPREQVAGVLFRPGEEGDRTFTFDLPAAIDAKGTRLEVSAAAWPAGPMLEALPFLAGYPYGCTEQTMSRFFPTVVVADALKKLGVRLEQLPPADPPAGQLPPERRERVAASAEIERMARAGLDRLAQFQHSDGGWGWWKDDASSPRMTAYVLTGLAAARKAGVTVADRDYERAVDYLSKACLGGRFPHSDYLGTEAAWHEEVYVAYALSLDPQPLKQAARLADFAGALLPHRAGMTAQTQALLALAFHHLGKPQTAQKLLREILARVKPDPRTAGVWLPAGSAGVHWHDNDVETNAWVLKAVVAIDPKHELASGLTEGLVSHRYGGRFWRSTRDSAVAVWALADFLSAARPKREPGSVVVIIDGKPAREIRLTGDAGLTVPALTLSGPDFPPGRHRVTLKKIGRAGVSCSARLRYFFTPDVIPAEGNGLTLRREYFRMSPDGTRHLLGDEAEIAVGDTVEVELTIAADQAQEYLAFEDPRPAGCEPLDLLSGSRRLGDYWANVELREDRLVFFLHWLSPGRHVLRYCLRAEMPGRFRALPARGFAMYAPEVRANSREHRLRVREP